MEEFFKQYSPVLIVESKAEHLHTIVEKDCQEWKLTLPPEGGEGSMFAYDFENNLQLFFFDAKLAEDWHIAFRCPDASPLLLLFSVRGKKACSINEDKFEFDAMESLVIACPAGGVMTLDLKKDEPSLFLFFFIHSKIYNRHLDCLPQAVGEELKAIFSGASSSKYFQKIGKYGLAGAAIVQEMLDDKRLGFVRCKYLEAKALEFFALQLSRWGAESVPVPERLPSLRSEDTEKLLRARHLLIHDLQNAPTIDELSKQAGVNRQKLKQGFRQLFGQSINEYLRNERLKTARHLLLNGDKTVGEVASRVGYENAGYFARRFREKFGILPSEFLNTFQKTDEG